MENSSKYFISKKKIILYSCFIIIFNKMIFILPIRFNGIILLYCLTYMSISRVSGAYDHKMRKGRVLDF